MRGYWDGGLLICRMKEGRSVRERKDGRKRMNMWDKRKDGIRVRYGRRWN